MSIHSVSSSMDVSSQQANNGVVGKNLGQQDFLRLMVAQIQNQDPMQPQVNGEFLSQLAQFSTNDGVAKMQDSLQQMASSLQSNQALQASALVGRKVLVNSNHLHLDSSGEVKTSFDMPAGVSQLSASIYSQGGALLKTIPLGQPEVGLSQFAWDGTSQDGQRLAAGTYQVAVRGLYSGQEVALNTMTSANIDSVSIGQQGEGLKLNVAGVGAMSLDQIRQISV